MKTTNAEILRAALHQFSEKGYDGTVLWDIAGELGITKSALYKHYGSKEELWNEMIKTLEQYYDRQIELPEIGSARELIQTSLGQLRFTLSDESVIQARRLLTLEQFRSPAAAELATRHFVTELRDMYARAFQSLMDRGIMRRDDPELLAMEYTSAISQLVHTADRQPELKDSVLQTAEGYIRWFAEKSFYPSVG